MSELAANFRIETRPTPMTELCARIDSERLIAARVPAIPEWSNDRKSMAVESVLLRQGIGAIYIHAGMERDRILDGNTRLFTIYHFIGGRLSLSGLKFFPECNGFHFGALPSPLQRRITDSAIDVREIHPSVSEETATAFVLRLEPERHPLYLGMT